MTLNVRSEKNLVGVDEQLAKVVRAVAAEHDILVIEGVRTKERQADLYAQGRTKPGPIVTWTLQSKHIEGRAVDVVKLKNGTIDWNDSKAFDEMGTIMLAKAKELGVKLRWGYDWNANGKIREKGETDGPHFELV
jgi:peptidoglycan L-alanyl-D-glutamate endopeptidase CwlK